MLLQDNSPAHSSIRVRQFLAQKMVAVLDHPPYTPDLAPAEFFLFPRLKAAIKGARFADVNAIKDRLLAVRDRFHRRHLLIVSGGCTKMCVVADDDYFKGQ